ncbi:enoyl-CoA hydratase-related protein [Bradyrhizobium sp. LHD-71]|uniref:enoyl-CoA hydratase-related protein n=1 Tax=Bradyrhizobium sp. LHD-71 TaxID=3072141 RepID=UPI00280D7852|nr:enoyl-CoA hydratase-related protein [Bradyrhizobium sp. LHD-71]MDQ8727487.1 enoyl-CoA hydratase-related protein [Bradyrhizobium sp. LHD-71]
MQEVHQEHRGAAMWLTIDREQRRNALNESVLRGLRESVASARIEDGVRAVVITGAGRTFCAGGDLKPDAKGDPFRVDPAEVDNPVVELFRAIVDCPVPVIARVNGHALAGGFGLVCACDFAVAVDNARFGTPESRIGLFPMMILPWLLRTISRRKVLEICVTGEPITAAEALAHGVVNHVVSAEKLDEKVEQLVASIAASSPTAIRIGRRALATMDALPLGVCLEYAQRVLPQMAQTEDAREGFRAFNEKRAPVWTGR